MTPELKAELAAIDDQLCDFFVEDLTGINFPVNKKSRFLDIIYRLRATYEF